MRAFCFSLILTIASSQSTLCVWNSIDFYDYLNGPYTLRSQKYDDQNSWERYTPDSCADIGHPGAFIFAAYYAPDEIHYWTIHSSLDSNDLLIDDYPECGNDWEAFPAKPTECQFGWQEWTDEETYLALPITITSGECPVLNCPFIEIANSGDTDCDKVYTKSADANHKNIFISSHSPKYLYFNMYMFRWYISDTLGTEECDSMDISDFFVASANDKWKDMDIGASFTLKMNTGATAKFSCISSTESPTKSPTKRPTQPPTLRPTAKPTEAPIRAGDPTKPPTLPTPAPTDAPTDVTDAPTPYPSAEPSWNPSIHTAAPTWKPTEATASPTQKSNTKKPPRNADDDALNAQRWNTTIQSSVFTVCGWMIIVCGCVAYIAWRKHSLKQAAKKQKLNESVIASNTEKTKEMSTLSTSRALSAVPSRSAQSAVSNQSTQAMELQLAMARRRKQEMKNKGHWKGKKGLVVNKSDNEMKITTECQECGANKLHSEGNMDSDGFWYCYDCWQEFYDVD